MMYLQSINKTVHCTRKLSLAHEWNSNKTDPDSVLRALLGCSLISALNLLQRQSSSIVK